MGLGTGVVDIPACVQALREIGYDQTISLEQESGDHDPTEDLAFGRRWVEERGHSLYGRGCADLRISARHADDQEN